MFQKLSPILERSMFFYNPQFFHYHMDVKVCLEKEPVVLSNTNVVIRIIMRIYQQVGKLHVQFVLINIHTIADLMAFCFQSVSVF